MIPEKNTSNGGATNVIFDLGGVLFAWEPDEIVDRNFDDLELRALVKREVFQHADWLEMDRGTLEEEDAIKRFHARTGIPSPKLNRLLQSVKESLIPIPESVDLLHELSSRGAGLYCLSNMPVCRFEYIQQRYPFWSLFEGIVISGIVKMIKPDREIFEHLLSQFQLPTGSTVFVDDHPVNLDSAQQIGLHTVLFRNADDCRRQLESMLNVK